jgi:hypothetical protein
MVTQMNLSSKRSLARKRAMITGVALAACAAGFACSSSPRDTAPIAAAAREGAPARGTPAGRQLLSGHLTSSIEAAPIVGPVPPSTPLHMTIGLPVKDQLALDAELDEIADPRSPRFRHYLTPETFADKYGATPSDYGAVVAWAESKNLAVTTHPNRIFLSVRGAAADLEQALNVRFNYARRPDGTQFYAPDAEPSLDLAVPVRYISHLDDYAVMRTAGTCGPSSTSGVTASGFRAAYAPGSSLTGQGQSIGIFGYQSFFFNQTDIDQYNLTNGISAPKVATVGAPGPYQSCELTLDIEAAQSMAPGAQIVMFYGSTDDILTGMTDNTQISQFSSSFYPSVDTPPPNDLNLVSGLQLLAAQGQSFFTCAGDSGAYGTATNFADVRSQNDVTVVGGTQLTLDADAGTYSNEVVWPSGGGGVLQGVGIPSYQVGLATAANEGSSSYRNLPDVSAIASNFEIYYIGAWQVIGGTSVATPTWAGFTALVNEQAHLFGLTSIGFANPELYTLAASPTSYAAHFHDVTSGSNGFPATPGYDLATGLGTPTERLILALAAPNVPPTPRCTYGATNEDSNPDVSQPSGWFSVECTPDAAGDPIYIFQQSTSGGWTPVLYYPVPNNALGGVVIGAKDLPDATSATFLGCTWDSNDFSSQAWEEEVTPGELGCDPAPTTVTVPTCTPETPAEACADTCGEQVVANGCGGTITCDNTCACVAPLTCQAAHVVCGELGLVNADGTYCGTTLECGTCPSGESCGGDRSACCSGGELGSYGHCCPSGQTWAGTRCLKPVVVPPGGGKLPG